MRINFTSFMPEVKHLIVNFQRKKREKEREKVRKKERKKRLKYSGSEK